MFSISDSGRFTKTPSLNEAKISLRQFSEERELLDGNNSDTWNKI
jgi:hypothetical protein